MKERPILMHARSVNGIMEGRKSQTRRIIKQPEYFACLTGDCDHDKQSECNEFMKEQAPYGTVGDRLWVREAFATTDGGPIRYYATDDVHELRKKKPSIHMPRWASRLTLEISDIRVQHVQDISNEDAVAEGIQVDSLNHAIREDDDIAWGSAAGRFAELWNETNGKGAWQRNDWVFVISFRRIQ